MSTITPHAIRLDLSTHCQLKCPSCPTAQGKIKEQLGSGFVSFDNFKKVIANNPEILYIELSNWGEVLLNPELPEMLAYAYENNVNITISNGANLNTAKPESLEALVKYQVRQITCSIDGASQATYAQYRIGGNFDRVIDNIKTINHYKTIYKTNFPILLWQFVPFGHNEHEISQAKQMAKELNMEFYVKLSWDEKISPLKEPEKIRSEVQSRVTSQSEYLNKNKKDYMNQYFCKQMFQSPQINWDGRILGCCINSWGDYGNAFEQPLVKALNNPKIRYARQMLLGKAPAKSDIPCTTCYVYQTMQRNDTYLKFSEIKETWLYHLGIKFGRWGIGTLKYLWFSQKWLELIIRSGIKQLP
ncbi:MAG: radical SAM/SPASM domain-containing protein [Microcystaceae cyanobacterium]